MGAPAKKNKEQDVASVASTVNTFPYHALPVDICLKHLESRETGLMDDEVNSRHENRANAASGLKTQHTGKIVLDSLRNLISMLLLAAAVTSFALHQPAQAMIILLAWVIHTVIHGFIKWKTGVSEAHVDEVTATRCQVRRKGRKQHITPDQLVTGDIILLSSGNIVPADARLITSDNLKVDESILTGESVLIPKNARAIHDPEEDLTAQHNMVFSGTRVKTGKGVAVVTAVDNKTIMGKIENLAQHTEKRESPFSRQVITLLRRMLLLVAILSAFVIAFHGKMGGGQPLELLEMALVMAIAALPGSLPGIVNLIYASGLAHLSQQSILVKHIRSLETMGTITTLCSDKTGTLTENRLELEQLYMPELESIPYDPEWRHNPEAVPHASIMELFRAARLNNSTVLDGLRSALIGDPLDLALFRAAPEHIEDGYEKRFELPFDSEKMRSATLCESDHGEKVWMIKGAPEAILEMCTEYLRPDGSVEPIPFSSNYLMNMFNRDIRFENNYRVIGLARRLVKDDSPQNVYENATFIGWVCLVDPPREGAKEAVEQLKVAGVHTVMITGDQKPTAEIAARELGIMDEDSVIWSYKELVENGGNVDTNVRVFARTKPEDKLYIVDHLQQNGEIVAMVGDGINDTPALQKSDVAIAMGQRGSETAMQKSDIVLMNDELGGIFEAIQQSRRLSKKVQTCVFYLMSCNLALLFFLSASVLLGHGLLLNLVDVLWLNLLIITVPTLALALEPMSSKDMDTILPPQGTLSMQQMMMLFFWGALMAGVSLGMYFASYFALKLSTEMATTMAFSTLAFCLTLNLFNIQSLNTNHGMAAMMKELAAIPVTWMVLLFALALQLLAIYLPQLNELLGTVALQPMHLLLTVGAGAATVLLLFMMSGGSTTEE